MMAVVRSRSGGLSAVLLLALGSIAAAGAQELDVGLTRNITAYVQLDIMAGQKVFRTEDGIQSMIRYSAGLDREYRDLLLAEHRQSAWVPSLVNLLTGGLGSVFSGAWQWGWFWRPELLSLTGW
jgi:hypothetical protein